MNQENYGTSNIQKNFATAQTEQERKYNFESSQHKVLLPEAPDMNNSFSIVYERYPNHRRPDKVHAEKVWNEAELSDEEANYLLEWLTDRQTEDPSWHPLAKGMYVPKLEKFLKERWWLSSRANRKS
ncbi:hypothetical protein P4S64_01915 [Vibrio sp. M60_M31a]